MNDYRHLGPQQQKKERWYGSKGNTNSVNFSTHRLPEMTLFFFLSFLMFCPVTPKFFYCQSQIRLSVPNTFDAGTQTGIQITESKPKLQCQYQKTAKRRDYCLIVLWLTDSGIYSGISWIYSSLLSSNNEILYLYNQYQILSSHKVTPLGKEVNLSMASRDSPSCSTNLGQLETGSIRKQQTWFPYKPYIPKKLQLIPYPSALRWQCWFPS